MPVSAVSLFQKLVRVGISTCKVPISLSYTLQREVFGSNQTHSLPTKRQRGASSFIVHAVLASCCISVRRGLYFDMEYLQARAMPGAGRWSQDRPPVRW